MVKWFEKLYNLAVILYLGMEFMGSYLTIKPARNDENPQNPHDVGHRSHRRSHYSQSERKDYSRDQDGYPEYGGRRSNYRFDRYNSPQGQPPQQQHVEQYPCR